MRRNIGNEVVIAFLIVAVIIVGLASAVLLSNTQDEAAATATQVALANATATATASNTPVPATFTPTATNTPVPTETATATNIATNIPPTATLTPTDVPPTATNIPPTATNTATIIPPTVTYTATHTATSIPPTATNTVTATEKVISAAVGEMTKTPTATYTSVPSNTPTEIPPTATLTATNTPVPTLTPTAVPPTVTNTPIPTLTPTEIPPTATNTAVPTDVPPSATATNTLIPTPTALVTSAIQTTVPLPSDMTLIPTPVASPDATQPITESSMVFMGIIPTPPPTPTVAPIGQATRVPSTCSLPAGWVQYRVNSGDTLFAIALATNSTVDELRYINCIEDIDSIQANDVVFIPRAPVRPVATIPATGVRQGLARIGCTDPRTQITSPIAVQRVSGTFNVFGTATRSDFLYYKIEIRPDWATVYNFYLDAETPVSNGALGAINSDLFEDGLHWILLTVVDQRAEIPTGATCEIPVIFG